MRCPQRGIFEARDESCFHPAAVLFGKKKAKKKTEKRTKGGSTNIEDLISLQMRMQVEKDKACVLVSVSNRHDIYTT